MKARLNHGVRVVVEAGRLLKAVFEYGQFAPVLWYLAHAVN